MNRFILVLLLTGAAHMATAQFRDRIIPHFGLTREVVTLTEVVQLPGTQPRVANAVFTMGNFGAYAHFAHKNDVVSAGVDASGQVGFQIFFDGQVSFSAMTPVYLMGRIGAGSTPYNSQALGFALGIGVNSLYMNLSSAGSSRLTSLSGAPSAVAQLKVNLFGSPMTGRIHTSLLPSRTNLNTRLQNGAVVKQPYDFTFFGLGLIYEL